MLDQLSPVKDDIYKNDKYKYFWKLRCLFKLSKWREGFLIKTVTMDTQFELQQYK